MGCIHCEIRLTRWCFYMNYVSWFTLICFFLCMWGNKSGNALNGSIIETQFKQRKYWRKLGWVWFKKIVETKTCLRLLPFSISTLPLSWNNKKTIFRHLSKKSFQLNIKSLENDIFINNTNQLFKLLECNKVCLFY